jgi:hypothetical protein
MNENLLFCFSVRLKDLELVSKKFEATSCGGHFFRGHPVVSAKPKCPKQENQGELDQSVHHWRLSGISNFRIVEHHRTPFVAALSSVSLVLIPTYPEKSPVIEMIPKAQHLFAGRVLLVESLARKWTVVFPTVAQSRAGRERAPHCDSK